MAIIYHSSDYTKQQHKGILQMPRGCVWGDLLKAEIKWLGTFP